MLTHQAKDGMQELVDFSTSENASKKWQAIAYEGVAPLQKAYLAAIDSLTNGAACAKLREATKVAGDILQKLLELEKQAQDCYIDAQLSILENTKQNSVADIEGKKQLRFHFFCSHVSAEMATHVSAAAMGLEHLGCDVWTDQQGRLDIDAFGMVNSACTQNKTQI